MNPSFESNLLASDLHIQKPEADSDIRTLAANSAPPISPRVPDAWQASKLWPVFLANVDPMVKVLHVPTTTPRVLAAISAPEASDDSQAMLVYAICYAAIVTLDSGEVEHLLGVERNVILKRFGEGIEQYLTKFSLIVNPTIEYIQALVIHLVRTSGMGTQSY